MDFDTQVRLAIYHHFARTGRAPSPAEVAKHIASAADHVLESCQRLRAQRLLVLEEDGSSIRMAPRFQAFSPSRSWTLRHPILCQLCLGRAWHTAALHRPATVHSRCVQSGEPFHLNVDIDGPEPSGWLFHCLVPAAKWWDNIVFT